MGLTGILNFKFILTSKMLLTIVLFFGVVGLSVILIPVSRATAHPGNTASDGGHYCWTNCEYWGEVYGERHFHGGSSGGSSGGGGTVYTGPTDYQQGTTNGANHANSVNRSYIESSAYDEGSREGAADGNKGMPSSTESDDSEQFCSQEGTWEGTPTQAYKTAFQASYIPACSQVYDAKYDAAYHAAYVPAKSTFDAELIAKKKAQDKQKEQYLLYGAVAVVLIAFGIGIRNSYQKKAGNN